MLDKEQMMEKIKDAMETASYADVESLYWYVMMEFEGA